MKTFSDKGTLYLVPESDLVASAIEELRNYFLDALKNSTDITGVIMDAADVDVVDSLGVNLIIGLYRQALSESKSFEIINAGEKFLKIAHFFKFPSIFPVKAVNGDD